ncbi:hypothetical protein [Roseovarius sp. 2305UL8-3]|uniref:hypothetical protein n=1 Tax=Roseovarius conchicola TaxID=3121636 RepID=UPI0035285688
MLRPLISDMAGRAAPRLTRLLPGRRGPDLDHLCKRVILPSLPVADEDMTRIAIWEKGRRLVRQDHWDELSRRVQLADDARLCTPGGLPETILLALGAHGDVVAAATDALHDGCPPEPGGLRALEEAQDERPDDYVPALVAALAHLRIGRAWLETGEAAGMAGASDALRQAKGHTEKAGELIAFFDAEDLDAPSLAAARAALSEGPPNAQIPDGMIKAYRDLITLDPDCPQHMRDYGAVLARTYGDPDLLDNEAGHVAGLTRPIWGDGGYAWVYLDALAIDPNALLAIDPDRFIAGLRALLGNRSNQFLANEIAALCALKMAPGEAHPHAAEAKRAALHGCLDWVLAQHLHELHPRLWADTETHHSLSTPRPGHRALIAMGRKRALQCIAGFFADQLSDGSSIAFSPAGMYRLPAF